MEILLLCICVLINIITLTIAIGTAKKLSHFNKNNASDEIAQLRRDFEQQQSALRQELNNGVQSSIRVLGEYMADNLAKSSGNQDTRLEQMDNLMQNKQSELQKNIINMLNQLELRFKTFAMENEQKLDGIRTSVEKKLSYIQNDNNQKLDDIKKIVDEKLQQTLEDKMTKSFSLVNERLEQVYKGLGEMQSLANGVGDLKKVLSNVKTRGILGEIQLGAILEEILAREQYETNVITKKGSQSFVEFAIKLPTEDGSHVLLPIDSKFPSDAYTQLMDAYDKGSPEEIALAVTQLKNRIKSFAKDIHDKYLDPPNTTDFAIMFLPFEGLYAEVINRGMLEILQRDYHINITGPSTMAALLNSLQMGFKTFAIQKRSSEVWTVLGAIKTEFSKFADVLLATQQRLEQANTELDKLVGVRTRQIQRRLKSVTSLSDLQASKIMEIQDICDDDILSDEE